MLNQDATIPSAMFLATIGSFGGNAHTAALRLSDPDRPSVLASATQIMREVTPVVEENAPILPPRGQGKGRSI